MDIANGVKHVKKAFHDLNHAIPADCGVRREGFPILSENHVFLDEDNVWLLHKLTEFVANEWKTRLGI